MPVENPELERKYHQGVQLIAGALRGDRSAAIMTSFGKDSSLVTSMTCVAAEQLRAQEHWTGTIFILSANTMIENPEVHAYAAGQLDRLRAWSARTGIPLEIRVTEPPLSADYRVKLLSGHQLPTMPFSRTRACSIDMKRGPLERELSIIRRGLAEEGRPAPIKVIGTRFAESSARKGRMRKRGECADGVWLDSDDNPVLSPIADLDTDAVYEMLALVGYGRLASFAGDFHPTLDLYTDAAGGECMIVAEGGSLSPSGGCGSRTGCHMCTAVQTDGSMAGFLARPENQYMTGLMQLRDYLFNTYWDLSRRRWVGRDSHPLTGHTLINPNGYSASMVHDLAWMMLTLDRREQLRADGHREAFENGRLDDTPRNRRLCEPQFELLPPRIVVAVDWWWSVDGLHPEHEMLRLYERVHIDGEERDVPVVPVTPAPAWMPPRMWLYVGAYETDTGHSLASPLHQGIVGDSCGIVRKRCDSRDGDIHVVPVAQHQTGPRFDVDVESAWWVVHFERSHLLSLAGDALPYRAYQHYLLLGTVEIPAERVSFWERICQRGRFWQSNGLAGDVEPAALQTRSISESAHDRLILAAAHALNPAVPEIGELRKPSIARAFVRAAPSVMPCPVIDDDVLYRRAYRAHASVLTAESVIAWHKANGGTPVFDGVDQTEKRRANLAVIRALRVHHGGTGAAILEHAERDAISAMINALHNAGSALFVCPGGGVGFVHDRDVQVAACWGRLAPLQQMDLFAAA